MYVHNMMQLFLSNIYANGSHHKKKNCYYVWGQMLTSLIVVTHFAIHTNTKSLCCTIKTKGTHQLYANEINNSPKIR